MAKGDENMEIHVRSLQRIKNFSHIRAVAEIEYGGIVFRGLKLEERDGRFQLASAGRKVNGSWQLVYELQNPDLAARLCQSVVQAFQQA